jgi:hypothetical protein
MDRHGLFSGEDRSRVRVGEKMKNTLLSFFAAAAALLLIPDLASAHHGWAAFKSEPESLITFKGTVKEFHFMNPHSVVEFEVKDDKGQIQSWEGELTSNTNLSPRGWTAASIEEKQVITIIGYPARSGAHAMRSPRSCYRMGKS